MTLIGIIDATSRACGGGLILEVEADNEHDLEAIMRFIQTVLDNSDGLFHTVTVVKSSDRPVKQPYVHPPLADKANEDDSYNLDEKTWFELIISVKIEPMSES